MFFWSRFDGVWGRVLETCWTILGEFGAFQKESNFEAKLKTEKVVRSPRGGGWPESLAALILVNDQSVHGIVTSPRSP